MHLDDFKQTVASFVGREPDYFCYNENGTPGPDKLLIAINNAKLFLQRQIDFEYSRCAVDLLVDPILGGSIDRCVDRVTGETVKVKKIEAYYLRHKYDEFKPLNKMTRRTIADQVRKGENHNFGETIYHQHEYDRGRTRTSRVAGATHGDPVVYVHGRSVFLYPRMNHHDDIAMYQHWYPSDYIAQMPESKLPPVPLTCDVIPFLPDYRSVLDGKPGQFPKAHTEDFILDFCADYMLFRALSELNVFLKDSEQISISQSKMAEALENIRNWNADIDTTSSDYET